MGHDAAEEERGNMLIFPFLAITAGIVLDEINKRLSFLGVPDSVLQFSFAAVTSFLMNLFLPSLFVHDIERSYSWSMLEPNVILTVLLPPLMFECAFKMNSHMFLAKLRFISALTVALYMLTLIIAAALLLPFLMATQNCAITSVFLFVCIIVATDPVAVVAMLEQFGAPHRLRILIEGESSLNDGLALTFYRVLVEFLKKEQTSSYEIDYLNLAIGLVLCLVVSPFLGALFAWFIAMIVSKIDNGKKRQAVILIAVYSIFVFCESIGGSAAIGLVMFGVMLNYYKEVLSAETYETALVLWQTMAYCANNIIFIFSGFVVGSKIFTEPDDIRDTTYNSIGNIDVFTIFQGVFISPVPLFARCIAVYIFYKLHKITRSTPLPSATNFVILAYSGLRGALGLIIAMELTKTEGLPDKSDAKMILLLTCSTTLACLIVQGLTFATVATKEGTTRRSKYVKDTCKRLCRYMTERIHQSMKDMMQRRSNYLVGTCWTTVKNRISDCLSKFQKDTGQTEEVTEDSLGSSRVIQEDSDAKIGFYGILLARVHDSWSHGAVSGSTSHVIVSLLEHGIDEGAIHVADIEEHLDTANPSSLFNYFSNLVEGMYTAIFGNSFLNDFGRFGPCAVLFPKGRKAFQLPKRKFEKWWIFHTLVLYSYVICAAYVLFDKPNSMNLPPLVLLIGFYISCMTIFEGIYLIHVDHKIWKNDPTHPRGARRPFIHRITAKEFFPSIINGALMTAANITATIILKNHECIYSGYLFSSDDSSCSVSRIFYFIFVMISAVYRTIRAVPSFIVILREQCLQRRLLRDRVRLAVLHYMIDLLKEVKISKDLFSAASYNAVMKEKAYLSSLIESLMRLELKEHEEEIDVVPVIKTRQAVRMMSYALANNLHELKTEGLLPEDAHEQWDEAVNQLRESAEAILDVPKQHHVLEALDRLRWLEPLPAKTKDEVVNFLHARMSISPVITVKAQSVIKTGGKKVYFVRKGICKVSERLIEQTKTNEFYAYQGELIGERNFVFMNLPAGVKKPAMCPMRKYETTTRCELVEMDVKTIKDFIAQFPAVIELIAKTVEGERYVYELRNYSKKVLRSDNFWEQFNVNGKMSNHKKDFDIPNKKIAIVGCWTDVVSVSPREAIDQNGHIHGPATIRIRPTKNSNVNATVYMVNMHKGKPALPNTPDNVVSLMYDTQHHVRVKPKKAH